MRILVITQKVDNDDILGFFCGWLNKLAKHIDETYVLAMEKGKIDLARNIKLYSLGKENGKARLRRFFKFNQVLMSLCLNKKIDIIFIHMCPEYAILTWPYAKLRNIPIVMWYAHRDTNLKLKIAHLLVNKVITPSKESFRIKSNKVIITGHGIDVRKFKMQHPKLMRQRKTILSVGRLSPIKNYEALIRAADILVDKNGIKNIEFLIVGGISKVSDARYYSGLKKMVKDLRLSNYVKFVGALPYSQIDKCYQECDIFVNTSPTGSFDKTGLEAMACEKPLFTCNEAFEPLLADYAKTLMFKERNAAELAKKIVCFLGMNEEEKKRLVSKLRNTILIQHGLDRLIDKFVDIFKNLLV